jgi:site-specific DNA-methyltransferase (adenine-specific)
MNITNEDNMKLMARYEDNHFDLAIVDPPYGKKPSRNKDGLGVAKRNFETGCDDWDIKPKKKYWKELFRVSKNQVIWGGNYFIENLHSSNSFVIWDKKRIGNIYADCEMAWTSFNSVAKIFKFQWHGMMQGDMKNKEVRIHPTQKPVKLYEWLLMNYAKYGDKILDTHLGSGSIAIACHNLGYDLTACELYTDYYKAATKRLKQHTQQLRIAT